MLSGKRCLEGERKNRGPWPSRSDLPAAKLFAIFAFCVPHPKFLRTAGRNPFMQFWVGSTAKKKLKIWVLGCYIG
jgi:hypothetical protein